MYNKAENPGQHIFKTETSNHPMGQPSEAWKTNVSGPYLTNKTNDNVESKEALKFLHVEDTRAADAKPKNEFLKFFHVEDTSASNTKPENKLPKFFHVEDT